MQTKTTRVQCDYPECTETATFNSDDLGEGWHHLLIVDGSIPIRKVDLCPEHDDALSWLLPVSLYRPIPANISTSWRPITASAVVGK
jgi:hypothetical protein